MDEEPCLPSPKENLLDLLRKVSVVQANQYFNRDDVELIQSPENHVLGQVLKRYIVMILLTGSEIRMIFKVHFNPEQMRAYRQSSGGKPEDLTDKHLLDYMKELSNQIGGRACRIFQSHGISLGMSIPLCTRGIYEIYADYQEKSGVINKFGDFWCLNGPFGFCIAAAMSSCWQLINSKTFTMWTNLQMKASWTFYEQPKRITCFAARPLHA